MAMVDRANSSAVSWNSPDSDSSAGRELSLRDLAIGAPRLLVVVTFGGRGAIGRGSRVLRGGDGDSTTDPDKLIRASSISDVMGSAWISFG